MNKPLFNIKLPFEPIPTRSNGKFTLVYESLLSNETSINWNIRQIEIVDTKKLDTSILLWTTREITENSRYLSKELRTVEAKTLEPGVVLLAYYWLTFEDEKDIPRELRHTFTLENEQGQQEKITLDVPVQNSKPMQIQPPFQGKRWFAAEASSNYTGHRRTLIPIDGQPYIAQRFAVDWMLFNEEGRLYSGSVEKNENWFCYGTEIMAVGDGVVSQVQNGIIENVPLSEKRAIEINLQNAPGNYVIIDMGNDHFAFYAHMIPGSITVKEGDRVHCGQVIGKLGNSGNSDAPHLHLHIDNRNSPLGCQGLPFHFPAYEWVGNTGSTDDFFKFIEANEPWPGEQPAQPRGDEYPGYNDLVNFLPQG